MSRTRISWLTALLFGVLLVLLARPSQAQPVSCGVVLLHGKWGMPQSPYLKPVVQKIEPLCTVILLEMPWSRVRLYDRPYADALAQIQHAVAQLRQSGVQWVALGGQSFGANASLAYMAQVGDVDALMPMAPGHVPENFYQFPDVRRVVDEAHRKVDEGQGDAQLELTDMNQGQRKVLKASAAAVWSYFNPQGWGNMALSAQGFRKSVPVLWVIGTLDPLFPSASADIYRQLPLHTDSRYLVVRATHANTPELAVDDVVTWLRARTGR